MQRKTKASNGTGRTERNGGLLTLGGSVGTLSGSCLRVVARPLLLVHILSTLVRTAAGRWAHLPVVGSELHLHFLTLLGNFLYIGACGRVEEVLAFLLDCADLGLTRLDSRSS